MPYSWGVVARPKSGQTISGDRCLVQEYGEGGLLLAMIDGLGGGEEAARPAALAAEILQANPGRPLQELLKSIHTALHGTRGAVAGLLRLETKTNSASYVGVGNIGVYVVSTETIKPISKSGILGFKLPLPLLELNYRYNLGDIFVLYSDGLGPRTGQDRQIDPLLSAQAIAEALFAANAKETDDATVLVVRTS